MSGILRKRMVAADVLTLARERVSKTYDLCDEVAVSFSGGKDSTVVLHLAEEEAIRRRQLPLKVFFWDEEAIASDTVDYLDRIRKNPHFKLYWLCLPIKHRNACSRSHPEWFPWAEEEKAKWCRPLPPEAITEKHVKSIGFTRRPIPECNGLILRLLGTKGLLGIFMGIRAAESLRRYRSVARRGYNNSVCYDSHCQSVILSKPIYDWSTEDVWTAPGRFGWDFNPAYDVMQAAGVPLNDQRVCPPYGEEPLRGLWIYAQCWPELWDKMINRVPGAATAGRYSRSPIYGHGVLEGWDANADPRKLIETALQRWPEKQRNQIAQRIAQEINLHYQKSEGEPLPSEHPSEMCWKFLYMVAVRGDLKNRKGVQYADYALRRKAMK